MPTQKRGSDPDHRPFEYLVGVSLTRWKGINKQGSAAAPAEDQLREGVNIRPIQDGYVSRSGQQKLTSAALGSIEGMFEAGDRGAPSPTVYPGSPPSGLIGAAGSCDAAAQRLYIVGGGVSNTQRIMSHYVTSGGVLTVHGNAVDRRSGRLVAKIGTCLIVALDGHESGGGADTARVQLISPMNGVFTSWLAFGDKRTRVTDMLYLASDGGVNRFFLGVSQGVLSAPGYGVLYSTADGVILTAEYTFDVADGDDSPVLLTEKANQVLVSYADYVLSVPGGGDLYPSRMALRPAGGGTLVDIPMDVDLSHASDGAPFITTYFRVRGLHTSPIGNVFAFGRYPLGSGSEILRYPGYTNAARAQIGRTISALCAANFNNNVYFGRQVGSAAVIAELIEPALPSDLTGWTDSIKDLTAQFPADNAYKLLSLAEWNGNLYALCHEGTTPGRAFLYHSPGTNVAGAWVRDGELIDIDLAPDFPMSPPEYYAKHMVVL